MIMRKNKFAEYVGIIALASLMALNYEIFIFKNQFAPAGIGGVATMIQYVFDFSVGYLTLIINIPLAVIAYFIIDRDFTLKSLTFSLVFSMMLLVLKNIDLTSFRYYSENGTSTVLAPVAAGTINGIIYGFAMKLNGSTGGMDIVAACIRKSRPHFALTRIIFTLNTIVAIVSYFVYGFKLEPVILCIIYCFITSTVNEYILKGGKGAIKFEIITMHADEISERIIKELRHSATIWAVEGAYTHNERQMLICLVNKHQIIDFQRILNEYDNTFAYISGVTETIGNFKRIKVNHEHTAR